MLSSKRHIRLRRKRRIRAKISGTVTRPRLSVFRSNQYIFAQLIDDSAGQTLAQADDRTIKKGTKVARAKTVGEKLAEHAKKKNIDACVFDRGGYRYHGRVKALAEGAREGGLHF